MSITLEYVNRLGRVKKTTCAMMLDRGYKLAPEEEHLLQLSDSAIISRYIKTATKHDASLCLAMSSRYLAADSSLPPTLVLFVDLKFDESKQREKMVSSEQAKEAVKLWTTNFKECTKCILIVPGRLSHDAKREISIPNLTTMDHDFLSFPVGRHVLVRPHIGLSKEDAEVFLNARKIRKEQLPRIKVTDPIVHYYGFEVGTIIRIDRALGVVAFRLVG